LEPLQVRRKSALRVLTNIFITTFIVFGGST
jgi:hypothetical protein